MPKKPITLCVDKNLLELVKIFADRDKLSVRQVVEIGFKNYLQAKKES